MEEKYSITEALALRGLSYLRKKEDESNVRRMNQNARMLANARVSLDDIGGSCTDRGNCLVTGGTSNTRNRLILACCRRSLANGRVPVVVHASDEELVYTLQQSGSPVLNLGTYALRYDPFRGYDDDEIVMSIIGASKGMGEVHTIDNQAIPYLVALLKLIRCRGQEPSFQKLCTAPHDSIGRIITESVNYGSLSRQDAVEISELISAANGHQYSVVYFLNEMRKDAANVLPTDPNVHAMSLKEALERPCIITVNIGSYANRSLLGMFVDELMALWSTHMVTAVLDDPMGVSKGRLWDMVMNSENNHLMLFSTRDVTASVDGDERTLNALFGHCPYQIVMKHGSDSTNTAVSRLLGEFEMTELKETHGTNSYRQSFLSFPGYGTNTTYTQEKRNVARVKPEEIRSLKPNEAYIVAGDSWINKVVF